MRLFWSIALLFLLPFTAGAQYIHEVRALDVRPTGEDYAPVFQDSGFVMVSVRESSAVIGFKDAETDKPLSDLYWVPFKDGVCGQPVLFSQNLTTPVNEGPAAFTNGGKTICFTRNQVLPKKLSNMRGASAQLGLFFSELQNGMWSAPTPFAHNDPKYSIMHPTFSMDGRTMYFASDIPGGVGGMDLYRSMKTAAGWSKPESLGPEVNTVANEVFPRMNADGTLAFASDRTGGQGKLDIYLTRERDGHWDLPEALPAPINSPANDHGYSLMPDGYSALFTSNRTGIDAIHFVKRTIPKFQDCTEQQRNNYCYAFSRRPHMATSSIPVDHVWDMGDGTMIKGYQAQHCYSAPGNYTVRSLLVDRRTGAIFYALSSNDLVVADIKQVWVNAQDTVRTGRALELIGTTGFLADIDPGEYQWDFGDGSTQEGSRLNHVFKQAGEYEVKLDVISKPGPQGVLAHQCNSKKIIVIDRFKDQEDMAVVSVYQDALGKNHSFEYQELPFDHTELEGEALTDVVFSVQLFASKERIDLDDARFIAIKKQFRVIERFDPELGVYTYSVGETKNVDELYQVFRKVKELQFLDAEVFAIREEKLMDLSQLNLSALEDLNHKKLRTSAIHFAYKSAALEPGSEVVLDQITGLMRQHPELQLVIEAHTDDIGSRQYNIELSQQRAASVVEYLAGQQVADERLLPIGHGKNQPIASNKTEEGRSLNRRVEFRMVVKGDAPKAGTELTGIPAPRSVKSAKP
ncbi:MAG: OmpA family protein [Flavobacteriales bacterium]|nr:OmpA family protein [Flavobacteriales bacterium]